MAPRFHTQLWRDAAAFINSDKRLPTAWGVGKESIPAYKHGSKEIFAYTQMYQGDSSDWPNQPPPFCESCSCRPEPPHVAFGVDSRDPGLRSYRYVQNNFPMCRDCSFMKQTDTPEAMEDFSKAIVEHWEGRTDIDLHPPASAGLAQQREKYAQQHQAIRAVYVQHREHHYWDGALVAFS